MLKSSFYSVIIFGVRVNLPIVRYNGNNITMASRRGCINFE